ncbi:MAG: glycosyltransferase family 2 protein, partial [Planctomycetes bacterium]|nr:glycosyltransferase family 2 protein [Planctomycetota bacterium]
MLENNERYIIITPAYNEADYMADTIESVLAQTVLPTKWIIVDDGSTDGTAGIVKKYESRHNFIYYHHRSKQAGQSYYASNVFAIMAGWEKIEAEEYEFLAILDADITLPKDYYERILGWFYQDTKLGVASGIYRDKVDGRLLKVLSDRRSTPKALQVFRRECFEHIGGYIPLKYGGEDTCSCIMIRMNGWKAWSFPNICAVHNKPAGRGGYQELLKTRFRNGLNEYGLASHPLFFLAKALRRCLIERPFMLSGLARMAGYVFGCIRGGKRQIPADVIKFIRREQIRRLFKANRIPDECKVETPQ